MPEENDIAYDVVVFDQSRASVHVAESNVSLRFALDWIEEWESGERVDACFACVWPRRLGNVTENTLVFAANYSTIGRLVG
jgi:hypothetical protein